MGHFDIVLPDNRLGSVQSKKVLKFEVPFQWTSGKYGVEQTRYVIKMKPAISNKDEYRLFRTKEGIWYVHPDEVQQIEDATASAIIDAIKKAENINA